MEMVMEKRIEYRGEFFYLQSSGRYYQSGRKESPERLLHRRIWIDAFGAIPDGKHVHHKNGDWTDNSISNLELVDASHHQTEHMRDRHSSGDLKSKNDEYLSAAREKAAEWHGSDDGRKWHSEHGKETWVSRATTTSVCTECGEEFLTYFESRAKFCSNSCEQKSAYKRNKTSVAVCALCGTEFSFNKYRKQECCSRACACRLAALRKKKAQ